MGRRNPFEQVAARHRKPDQCADDGVAHQPGLVRQEHDHEAGLDECKTQFRAQGAGVTTQRHAGRRGTISAITGMSGGRTIVDKDENRSRPPRL